MAKRPSKGNKTPTNSRKRPVNAKSAAESTKTDAVIDAIPPEVHQPAEAAASPAKPTPSKPAATKSAKPKPAPPKAAPPEPKAAQPKSGASKDVTPAPSAPPPQAQGGGGGFLPLMLGGLIAGAIGYFIGTLSAPQPDTTLADQIAAQSASIDALENQIAGLPTVDLRGVEAAQATLASDISAVQTQLGDDLGALDARIAELESLPAGDGTISDRAIAAYEAEVDNLRAEVEALTGTAVAQLEAARAEAAAIEGNAEAAARAAAGRAALARIQISLDNGEPLGAALGDLEAAIDGAAPDALLAAQGGVPTLASLQESFPDVAIAALAAARDAGVAGEDTGGFGAFLRNQLEVRSITPKEGTSTDAILSRAEAAVKAGRLSDALAEIAALPEEARVEMSDWLAQAEGRAAAIAAVDMFSTSLNDN